MGWFSRVFGGEKKVEEKPKTKIRHHMQRSFDGGKINRLLSGSGLSSYEINDDLIKHLQTLTMRARHLAKNDDYVVRFIQLVKNNVVGPRGIVLRAQVQDTNGQPDKAACDAIETAWRDWSRPGNPEVSGKLSRRDIEALAVESLARDGEFIAVKVPHGPYRFGLQCLDPFQLPVGVNTEDKNTGNKIIMGVEVDEAMKPVAYHLRVDGRFRGDTWQFRGQELTRIPARRVIHLFRQQYATQVRGFTPMASAIMRLSMLNGYEEAALVAARIGASKMGFYVPNDSGGTYEGDDEDSDGNLIAEVEPGIFEQLPSGFDFKTFDPAYPNIGYKEFVSSVLKGISAGLGVSYPSLSGDLEGVNFSSIRTAVLEDREAWKDLQEWVIDHLSQPIYDEWLVSALGAGKIRINGQAIGGTRYEKFRRVAFQGRRWAWVDPLKDMNANIAAVNARIRSVSDVIREQGQDPDDVFLEIQRERERMEALGIEPQDAINVAQEMNNEAD